MQIRPIAFVAVMSGLAAGAHAAVIDWNTWSSSSAGSTAGGVGVTYTSSDAHNLVSGYPTYTPTGTWADGSVVDNAPVAANGIVQIYGGTGNVNTLTFSTAVVNPVLAIWSLGQGGTPASFVFQGATPVFVSGGTSAEYGGAPITVLGNTVSGNEGNGTVQFLGTFNSLSWTNPQYENWYGFNVGIANAVPEPEVYALLIAGLGLAGWLRRRR
jgi:hypothetical protein